MEIRTFFEMEEYEADIKLGLFLLKKGLKIDIIKHISNKSSLSNPIFFNKSGQIKY